MTTLIPSLYTHACASDLQSNITAIHELIRAKRLPPGNKVDPHSVLADPFNDRARQRRLTCEAARHHLDTRAGPLAEALLSLARDLRNSGEEQPPYGRGLIAFRSWSINAGISDLNPAFYPVDRFFRPWRKHRVRIFKPELEAAGYSRFAKLFTAADPYADPEGDLRLGPPEWVVQRNLFPELRGPRADFLERLANIIAQRPAVEVLQ